MTLTEIRPGEGYWIYATQAISLTYPSALASSLQGEEPGVRVEDPPARATALYGGVSATPSFTVVYGDLRVNGQLAPPGTRVEAVTPRGEVAGCFVVETAGRYGFMHVYGEDGGTPPLPGFRAGEPLRLRVNGVEATPEPAPAWQDDHEPHRVDLRATVPLRLYLPLVVK